MKDLTEREIIRIITNQFAGERSVPLGFSDDVSAIPLSSKTWIIVKTDMLVGSTDIPPGMTNREAARKAVVATISDFAAKGVKPQALMVSIGLPAPVKKTTAQDIARGLGQAAREYDCKIIGGDTNRADDLVLDIVGVGLAKPEELVRRDGACPGDVVAVTGSFGKSSAGLRILMSKQKTGFAKEHRLTAMELALYGGEEYELVVTIRPERFKNLKRIVPSLRRIGIVEKEPFGVSARIGRQQIMVEARGWQHFT